MYVVICSRVESWAIRRILGEKKQPERRHRRSAPQKSVKRARHGGLAKHTKGPCPSWIITIIIVSISSIHYHSSIVISIIICIFILSIIILGARTPLAGPCLANQQARPA